MARLSWHDRLLGITSLSELQMGVDREIKVILDVWELRVMDWKLFNRSMD